MARIVIDPITRIEGHLRIEARIARERVVDAWSSGTMFRGIELILKDRDPRDAWVFCQRICGVCTTVHALASVRAVENALGIVIPDNARIIRNLIAGTQFVQDHVIHFYHLHGLDWVDILSALTADPSKTSAFAQSMSDWPRSSISLFKDLQKKLKLMIDSGQLGPFANAYWGHPAYKLPPEANLIVLSHYLDALDWQREVAKIHATLGAKNPHPQSYLVGGMAVPVDPNSQNALNARSLSLISENANKILEFVKKVYIPDLLAVASFYKDWAKHGTGVGNYMTYGEFPTDTKRDTENLSLPRGRIVNNDLSKVHPVDQAKITEFVEYSWYEYRDGIEKHPFHGVTVPHYTGPKPPYDYLNTDGKYSWVKAPRYDGMPMEVGPLARMLVGYASGHQRVREVMDMVLKKLTLGKEALFSTLGRIAARGVETLVVAELLPSWIDELSANMKKGDYRVHNPELWEPSGWPKEAKGFGMHEAPRGSLCHWIEIEQEKIKNYQIVVPSTWNLSPRDASGIRGPLEKALIGTPVADPDRPVEILRTVHSFDPCMACAVHILDAKSNKTLMAEGS